MGAVNGLQRVTGKGLSLVEFSVPFAQCDVSCRFYTFPFTALEKIRMYGAIPLFSWNSGASGGDPARFGLAELRSGRYDRYIRYFARSAKAWGWPFFLRFDWEMNGNWFPWGAGANGNEEGEFKLAWRHVWRIFQQVGASNVTWVWCPVAGVGPFAPFYPGDRYVDWTCLDGYNWGPDSALKLPWRSFSEIFAPAYRKIAGRIAPDKPMLLGEVASIGGDEEKAAWIREMFANLRSGFPKVSGLAWFDKIDNEMSWPFETSAAASTAFAEGLRGRYTGNAFSRLKRSPIPAPGG